MVKTYKLVWCGNADISIEVRKDGIYFVVTSSSEKRERLIMTIDELRKIAQELNIVELIDLFLME